ncbi:MAG: helix-turn-helix domain-containing protein [Clostridia bacterium]|nr:helix-turn-helix domain-containing protein [Clostridia bacterium]
MVHYYSEDYLDDAMNNLGEAMYYAVTVCGLDPDEFMDYFIASGVAHQFERGNPTYLYGMTGTEIAMDVLRKMNRKTEFPPITDGFIYTEIYWGGWILAYYQWETGRSFRDILWIISMKDIIEMYYPLHEAPESKFVDVLDAIIVRKTPKSRLQQVRKQIGYTQKQLAEKAEVNLRTLQQYEAGAKDINKASVQTVMNLAKVLCCSVEDIIEYPTVAVQPDCTL